MAKRRTRHEMSPAELRAAIRALKKREKEMLKDLHTMEKAGGVGRPVVKVLGGAIAAARKGIKKLEEQLLSSG